MSHRGWVTFGQQYKPIHCHMGKHAHHARDTNTAGRQENAALLLGPYAQLVAQWLHRGTRLLLVFLLFDPQLAINARK